MASTRGPCQCLHALADGRLNRAIMPEIDQVPALDPLRGSAGRYSRTAISRSATVRSFRQEVFRLPFLIGAGGITNVRISLRARRGGGWPMARAGLGPPRWMTAHSIKSLAAVAKFLADMRHSNTVGCRPGSLFFAGGQGFDQPRSRRLRASARNTEVYRQMPCRRAGPDRNSGGALACSRCHSISSSLRVLS